MSAAVSQSISQLENLRTTRSLYRKLGVSNVDLVNGTIPIEKFRDLRLIPDSYPKPSKVYDEASGETHEYYTDEALQQEDPKFNLDRHDEPLDYGNCTDPSDMQADASSYSRDQISQGRSNPIDDELNPPDDNELLDIVLVFIAWTGIDPVGLSPDYLEFRDWTVEEMMEEINQVRNFLLNDMTQVLGLKGTMAQIHGAIFMRELEEFTEEELMAYGIYFHFDFQPLAYIQESIKSAFDVLSRQELTIPAMLDERKAQNEEIYLRELRSLILDRKIWMLERLRLWRWREEVLLNRAGDSVEDYPGLIVIPSNEFESAAELIDLGISNFYFRVGEVKREHLVETGQYEYFDLLHMIGYISKGVKRDVDITTDTQISDLADLIILLLEKAEIDPRHLVTPLGIYVMYNREKTEVIYNCRRNQVYNNSTFFLACSHAGLDISRETIVELEDGVSTVVRRQEKPKFVLMEELTSQYLSPQFYTGVESHRDYLGAITDFRTLSDDNITQAEDGDILFFGIGDGFSRYRIYRPIELAQIFTATGDFIDPYSFRDNPTNPFKWSRFSLASIRRLSLLVLPQLKTKSKTSGKIKKESPSLEESESAKLEGRKDIDLLETAIMSILESLYPTQSSFQISAPSLDGISLELKSFPVKTILEIPDNIRSLAMEIHPRTIQERIIQELKDNLEEIRSPLMTFFAFLFNLGVTLSDWEESMIGIHNEAIQAAIEEDSDWKDVDPETTVYLTSKIFDMITIDVEKYINVQTDTKDFAPSIRALRMVKHYSGAYRIDWNDELSSIKGHLNRMVDANSIGLYPYIKISGNWMMATSNYYCLEIFGHGPSSLNIDIDI